MKRILYTLVVLCAFGLLSCRKTSDDFTIKQFDADQIQTYIKNNGLTTVMLPDTSGHYNGTDTTGIYYQIITPGKGRAIAYSDKISYVYSGRSLDGNYTITDTILNHINTYAAYVSPNGLQLAIKNIARYKGAKIRVLIPSRLGYGVGGTTLSTYNTAGTVIYKTVGGNQGLDFTVTIIDDDKVIVNNPVSLKKDTVSKQSFYDDYSIKQYMAANGLTGYTKVDTGKAMGAYYKITQVGTGTDIISISSTVGVQYTGLLFNGIIFDNANNEDGTAAATFTLYDVIPAWQGIFPKVTAGAKLSILTPSGRAYGQSANTQGTISIPSFSCLRFDINVITVTN